MYIWKIQHTVDYNIHISYSVYPCLPKNATVNVYTKLSAFAAPGKVPTTFREMFLFNAAVMGFGGSTWMDIILDQRLSWQWRGWMTWSIWKWLIISQDDCHIESSAKKYGHALFGARIHVDIDVGSRWWLSGSGETELSRSSRGFVRLRTL